MFYACYIQALGCHCQRYIQTGTLKSRNFLQLFRAALYGKLRIETFSVQNCQKLSLCSGNPFSTFYPLLTVII